VIFHRRNQVRSDHNPNNLAQVAFACMTFKRQLAIKPQAMFARLAI